MKPTCKKRLLTVTVLGVVAILTLLGPGPSWAITLFNTHQFAAQRSEIAQSPDVTGCSSDLDRVNLCRKNFRYLDLNWSMGYRFIHDRLTQILLFKEYNAADRTWLLKKLSQDYRLAALKRGQNLLDLVRLSTKESKTAYNRKMRRFERQGLAESALVYVFFEKLGLGERAKKAKSIQEMMIKMSILTRELDLWVEERDGAKRIVLSFAMPRAAMSLKDRWARAAAKRAGQEQPKAHTYTPPQEREPEDHDPPTEPFVRHQGRL